jgi:hypothetical protein
VQVLPSRGRLAISYLTLFGAFASTVFWVVGHYLNQSVGWRQTLVAFAVINLVCLPLNWFGLARREAPRGGADPSGAAAPAHDGPPLAGSMRAVAMVLFALVMSLNGFVFAVVTVQLVPLLRPPGLGRAAVWPHRWGPRSSAAAGRDRSAEPARDHRRAHRDRCAAGGVRLRFQRGNRSGRRLHPADTLAGRGH